MKISDRVKIANYPRDSTSFKIANIGTIAGEYKSYGDTVYYIVIWDYNLEDDSWASVEVNHCLEIIENEDGRDMREL